MEIPDTSPDFIEHLRLRLQPRGSKPLVRMQMKTAAFFDHDFITKAIGELEMQAKMQAMGVYEMNTLEILALHLLTDSAEF